MRPTDRLVSVKLIALMVSSRDDINDRSGTWDVVVFGRAPTEHVEVTRFLGPFGDRDEAVREAEAFLGANVSVWIGSLGSPGGSDQVIECLDSEARVLPEPRVFEWSGRPLSSARKRRLDEMLDNVSIAVTMSRRRDAADSGEAVALEDLAARFGVDLDEPR